MIYINDALSFAIETLLGLYLIAVILRFLFQLLRVDFRNPIAQTIVTITNPPLKFLRRFIPGLFGIDLAAVLLILLVALIKLVLILMVGGISFKFIGLLIYSLGQTINVIFWIFIISVLIRVVISWVAPRSYHPAVSLVNQFTEPVMAPLRRMLPGFGGLDFSPILLLLGLQLLQKLTVHPLLDLGRSLI